MCQTNNDAISEILSTTNWDFLPNDNVENMAETLEGFLEFVVENHTTKVKERQNIFHRLKNDSLEK